MEPSSENDEKEMPQNMNIHIPSTGSPPSEGQSSFMGMDLKVLGLIVVVVILLLSNVLFAFEVIDDFGDDDDDEGGDGNGNGPETKEPKYDNLSVAESNELIQNNTANVHFVIIDVRTPTEFDESHITDAMNIDVQNDSFENRMGLLNMDVTYLIYCQSGVRSAQAMSIMAEMGFMNVNNMLGGFTDWEAAGYEFVSNEPPVITQIIKNITVVEAFDLIQNNIDSTEFVIIDVRTPLEYSEGYIPGAINTDFWEDTFETHISMLDRNFTYLLHCKGGGRSAQARDLMEEKGFTEVYNMLGGFMAWKAAGYDFNVIEPVIPAQVIEDLNLTEAYSFVQNNTNNSNFVILDVRKPGEYVDGHLNHSVNFDYWNASFESILDILDKNLTYFVHCQSGGRSAMARDKMEEKGFMIVYNMEVGFREWKEAGYEFVV